MRLRSHNIVIADKQADKVRKGVFCIFFEVTNNTIHRNNPFHVDRQDLRDAVKGIHSVRILAPQLINRAEIYGLPDHRRLHPSARHEPPNAALRRTYGFPGHHRVTRRSGELDGSTVREDLDQVLSCVLRLPTQTLSQRSTSSPCLTHTSPPCSRDDAVHTSHGALKVHPGVACGAHTSRGAQANGEPR